jgi:hypothetical protein
VQDLESGVPRTDVSKVVFYIILTPPEKQTREIEMFFQGVGRMLTGVDYRSLTDHSFYCRD